VLTAHGVEYSYGQRLILSGVDLEVHRGDVVGVEGRSGSGKSTLMHVLAGLLVPDRGVVALMGDPLSKRSESDRARVRLSHVGFVFQTGGLVPEFSAVENVELPLLLLGRPVREAREAALELLDELEVFDQAGKRLAEMSGGQYQRVAVARALIHDPIIVFADEPTGSLDEVSAERVLEATFRCARKRGSAVLMVSHDREVTARADRIVCLSGGTLH